MELVLEPRQILCTLCLGEGTNPGVIPTTIGGLGRHDLKVMLPCTRCLTTGWEAIEYVEMVV